MQAQGSDRTSYLYHSFENFPKCLKKNKQKNPILYIFIIPVFIKQEFVI